MFKIAYCAGHYLGTAGKRLPRELDPNETREWVLNDRVADHFAEAALEYEGVELLRTDDPTGNTFIDIPERTAAANAWGADLYLDMHHNAGINLGTGGGVVAFSYPGSEKGGEYRKAIYEAVIAAGGLRGNRSQPEQEVAYESLRRSNMPAVLMEYGFMDSRTDAPVILQDSYSRLVAYGTMAGIAKAAGLVKQQAAEPETEGAVLPILQRGIKSDSVRALQMLLIGWGFDCGTSGVDGSFGPDTQSAVKAYQTAVALPVTGIVDEGVWYSLLGL